MTRRFAGRINRLQASPIRDILQVIDQAGMVSFAGGLPDHDSFPTLRTADIEGALQYGPSEGEHDLREWIAHDLQQKGLDTKADRILILSGSQQGIDLTAKLLVDEGTRVAVESPTYLAALQVFTLFGADYISYDPTTINTTTKPTNNNTFNGEVPQLLYTIPTFQNPTGHVYSNSERVAVAQLCDDNDIVLFEDDPYRELAYDSCDRTPVCSLLRKSDWIYQSSFSKTICPGLRLGYLTCSESLYPRLLHLKQAADLHSNRLSQQLVLEVLKRSDAQQRITDNVQRYRQKRDAFDALLSQHLSTLATWQTPKGGLFFWLTLTTRNKIDTRTLLPKAIEAGVAFMPGEPFYCDGRDTANTLRLNFSHADPQQAERGLQALARLIAQAV